MNRWSYCLLCKTWTLHCSQCGMNGCSACCGTLRVRTDKEEIKEMLCGVCFESMPALEKEGVGKPKGLNSILGIAETWMKYMIWHTSYFIHHGTWNWFERDRWII